MDTPIACTLVASDRDSRELAIRRLFNSATRSTVIDCGIEVEFTGNGDWLRQIGVIAEMERESCRFLQFEVVAKPNRGPVTVRITGPEGTETFLEPWLGS